MGGPYGVVNRATDGLTGLRVFGGFAAKATTACEFEIRDGSAAGALLASGRTAAAGDVAPVTLARGVATAGGVYVEIVSGTVTIAVFGA